MGNGDSLIRPGSWSFPANGNLLVILKMVFMFSQMTMTNMGL